MIAAVARRPINVSARIAEMARERPRQPAVVVARGKSLVSVPFAELDARIDALARGFAEIGVGRGVRTALLVRPSIDFFALVFALLRGGAVPVLIDPAIGRARFLRCIAEVEPRALVGVPAAHVARLLFPSAFRSVHTLVTVGALAPWGGHLLRDLERPGSFEGPESEEGETAAILFTSGSTGVPKGAVYTHGVLDAQLRAIRDLYGLRAGEVDVATFPPFALFVPALGLTAVVPDMDARYPARADPARILAAVEAHGAAGLFASPALLDRLSRHALEHGRDLRSLRRVITAGAPVRLDILRRTTSLLAPGVQVFTPFGATEALPVASVGSTEVLEHAAPLTARGAGVCVGRPVPGAVVRIIRITDEPIASWSPDLELPRGEIGEITVRGPMVTPAYAGRPEADRLGKIRDGRQVVHRMGDAGYLDEDGRLWMCGRKAHRVETEEGTLFSVCVEGVFDQHPGVKRTALVGVGPRGAQRPVLVVEPEPGATGLVPELLALGATVELTRGIEDIRMYRGPLPVDVRHNAKIDREALAAWAAR